MIECQNCKASISPPKGVELTLCPFCQHPFATETVININTLTVEEKIKYIVAQFSPEVYLETYKFKSLLMDFFSQEKKLLKIMLKIVEEQGAKEIYHMAFLPTKDFLLEKRKFLVKFSEDSLIPAEILEEGVDFLCGGLRDDDEVSDTKTQTVILDNDIVAQGQITEIPSPSKSEEEPASSLPPPTQTLTTSESPIPSEPSLVLQPQTVIPKTTAIEFDQKKRNFYLSSQEIKIPENYDYISKNAFRDNPRIKTVKMSNDVIIIDSNAFEHCTHLEEVILSDSLLHIGENAFHDCDLKKLILPPNLLTIGSGAFDNCKHLEEVVFPDSLLHIEENTFRGCNLKLKKLIFPKSLTSIASGAFENCKHLEEVRFPDSLLHIGENAFRGCSLKFKKFILPKSLITIESGAFENSMYLNYVEIPCNVKEIGSNVFADCKNLINVKISNLDTKIHPTAFQGTPWQHKEAFDKEQLENIRIPMELLNNQEEMNKEEYLRYAKSQEKLLIPKIFSEIPENSFKDNKLLKTVFFSDEILTVEESAFENCSNLSEVSFSEELMSIGATTFACCNLKTIKFPDSLFFIEKGAFFENKHLEEVFIPENIVYVKEKAFANCSCLKKVVIESGATQISPDAFENTPWEMMQQ